MEPSLPVRLTSLVFRKIHTLLHAASVTISFGSTVRHAPKVSRIPGTSSVTVWSIGRVLPWMICGKNWFFNNVCGKFLLVVYVATFGLLFGLLFGSLFGLLTASTCSSESIMSSTCSSELLMVSTCSSESECAELLIVYWIVHLLNYFIVSARMPEAIRLSYVTSAYFFCA